MGDTWTPKCASHCGRLLRMALVIAMDYIWWWRRWRQKLLAYNLNQNLVNWELLDGSKRWLLLGPRLRHWILSQIWWRQQASHFKCVVARLINGRPHKLMKENTGFPLSSHLPPIKKNSRRNQKIAAVTSLSDGGMGEEAKPQKGASLRLTLPQSSQALNLGDPINLQARPQLWLGGQNFESK